LSIDDIGDFNDLGDLGDFDDLGDLGDLADLGDFDDRNDRVMLSPWSFAFVIMLRNLSFPLAADSREAETRAFRDCSCCL